MISSQCTSVSELSRNASAIIRRVKSTGRQYIFVNNKPEAIILDIRAYEALGIEDDIMWTPEIAALYKESIQDLQENTNILSASQIREKYDKKV